MGEEEGSEVLLGPDSQVSPQLGEAALPPQRAHDPPGWDREATSASSRDAGAAGKGGPQEGPGTLSRERAPSPLGSILPLTPCPALPGVRALWPGCLPTLLQHASSPTPTPPVLTPPGHLTVHVTLKPQECQLGKAGSEPHLGDTTGCPRC